MEETLPSERTGQIRLFSFGTLQQPNVQRSNFGRELAGHPDSLAGYRQILIEITDPHVVAVSGSAQHPMLIAAG